MAISPKIVEVPPEKKAGPCGRFFGSLAKIPMIGNPVSLIYGCGGVGMFGFVSGTMLSTLALQILTNEQTPIGSSVNTKGGLLNDKLKSVPLRLAAFATPDIPRKIEINSKAVKNFVFILYIPIRKINKIQNHQNFSF
ncbi:MAG: hypothetical protein JWS08_08660 [Phormidium sp. PBR-2020]|nr:MAG: hypothetical protein JWS08_08660 [Phormidium sp. PBR-2020]